MKRITLTLVCLAAFGVFSTMAQRPEFNEKDMEARRAERIEKQAEKLAKDFGLKDDARKSFMTTYKEYMNEKQAVRPKGSPNKEGDKNEKLSDEAAVRMIEDGFAQQQQRLDIDKKYYAKLKKSLTPQQLLKVFGNQNNRQRGQQRNFNGQQGRPNRSPNGGFGGGQGGGFNDGF